MTKGIKNWKTSSSNSSVLLSDYVENKQKEVNLIKLVNKGYSCYANSIVQTIMRLEHVMDLVRSENQGKISQELMQLSSANWSQNNSSDDLLKL